MIYHFFSGVLYYTHRCCVWCVDQSKTVIIVCLTCSKEAKQPSINTSRIQRLALLYDWYVIDTSYSFLRYEMLMASYRLCVSVYFVCGKRILALPNNKKKPFNNQRIIDSPDPFFYPYCTIIHPPSYLYIPVNNLCLPFSQYCLSKKLTPPAGVYTFSPSSFSLPSLSQQLMDVNHIGPLMDRSPVKRH